MTAATDQVVAAIEAVAPLAALTIAAVFTVAAVAKLAAPTRTSQEMADLGLPGPRALARAVPLAELAIAATLLVRPNLGAQAALGALMAFTGVLVGALRSGRSVSCGCLGALTRRPISVSTVARNVGLIVISMLAAAAPSPSGALPTLPPVEVAMAAGSAALLVTVVGQVLLVRAQLGRLWSVDLAGESTTSKETS